MAKAVSVVFSSKDVKASQRADGCYSWSGQYKGIAIKKALPIGSGKQCILLLDPDATNRSVFENLICIDQSGEPVWTAKLPSNPDSFLDIALCSEGMSATTWSGFKILLDPNTGKEMKRHFVK